MTSNIKIKKINKDKDTKVIIIEGSGKGFSAGHNLKEVRVLKKRIKYQKQYDAFSPGPNEWPALLRRCDVTDPSYKE